MTEGRVAKGSYLILECLDRLSRQEPAKSVELLLSLVNAGDVDSSAENEARYECVALRDIFGNPFRPVVFDPAWRTDTALSLARQMYESRDFGAMPILADALQPGVTTKTC